MPARARRWSVGTLAALALGQGCARPEVIPAGSAACAPMRALPLGAAGFLPYAHSHNDYEQPRPLLDALDQRFYSVEADLWLRGGEPAVSHDAFSSKGTLKALYLDPLQARVSQSGSVHGDGVGFFLWLDLKDGSAGLREALAALLEQYPMLTVFDEAGAQPGAVTVVLTGDDASKRAFVSGPGPRRATRDSNDCAPSDPAADLRWTHCALDWGRYLGWNGVGVLSAAERTRLECLVGDIHAHGRRVRFWSAPETAAYRELAIAVGVDFIGTDDVAGLHDFLANVAP